MECPGIQIFSYDLFISHNQEEDVSLLASQLKERGINVAYDSSEIIDNFGRLDYVIADYIEKSRYIGIYKTSMSRASEWCSFEREHARIFKEKTGVDRLITISLVETSPDTDDGLVFYIKNDEIEELANYLKFNNRLSINYFIFKSIRSRLKDIEDHEPLWTPPEKNISTNEADKFLMKVVLNWDASNLESFYLLALVRQSLMYIPRAELNEAIYSCFWDALISILTSQLGEEHDGDARADLLTLSIFAAIFKPIESVERVAHYYVCNETSVDNLEMCHFEGKSMAGQHWQSNNLLHFTRLRANALKNTYLAKSSIYKKIRIERRENFSNLERSKLFAREMNGILSKKEKWNDINFEAISIHLFQCLFDSDRPFSAKPLNIDQQSEEILGILISALEQFISHSKNNNGRPVKHIRGLYSDFVLPVLALGINNNIYSERFLDVAEFIHSEFLSIADTVDLVPIYEWYLFTQSKKHPTTKFLEFQYRLNGIID